MDNEKIYIDNELKGYCSVNKSIIIEIPAGKHEIISLKVVRINTIILKKS